MVVNYNNGKIYKIVPKSGEDEAYIGSTTKERLCQRMQQHRSQYVRYKNGNGCKVTSYELFDKYGVDNCEIVLIELVNCNSKDELHIRERFWIESSNCVNKCIVGRKLQREDKELYNQTHREYQRKSREVDREKFNQYHREYYKLHKKRRNDDLEEDFFEMFRENENDFFEDF